MSGIYDQHRAAFSNVSAYAILGDTSDRFATIALKFPKDGAGRLYAYVHVFGEPMVRGFAAGGGYDKRSAAIADAVRKMPVGAGGKLWETYESFCKALASDDGRDWQARLRDAGFTVLQAV